MELSDYHVGGEEIDPRVTVGIVTWNRRKKVLEAIASALRREENVEILVVDNGSEDGTPDAIREHFPQVRVIELHSNIGCPGARNVIFEEARGEYILCLDDDGLLDSRAVKVVTEVFDGDISVGAVALRLMYTNTADRGRWYGSLEHAMEVGSFSGGCVCLRKSALDDVGYYPAYFFLYAEEADLSLRLLDAGYKIIAEPRAVMWHPRIGGSDGRGMDIYRFRNPLLVAARLYPPLMMTKYIVFRTVRYCWMSIRRRTFRAYLTALLEFCQLAPRVFRSERRPVAGRVLRWHRTHRSCDEGDTTPAK